MRLRKKKWREEEDKREVQGQEHSSRSLKLTAPVALLLHWLATKLQIHLWVTNVRDVRAPLTQSPLGSLPYEPATTVGTHSTHGPLRNISHPNYDWFIRCKRNTMKSWFQRQQARCLLYAWQTFSHAPQRRRERARSSWWKLRWKGEQQESWWQGRSQWPSRPRQASIISVANGNQCSLGKTTSLEI